MPLAVFITPKLVRIRDPNLNLMDVWMVEFPFWLAEYLCEQKALNENGQHSNSVCQMPLPTFHTPCAFIANTVPCPSMEDLVTTDLQCTSNILENQQFMGHPLEPEKENCVMDLSSSDPNVSYTTQSQSMAAYSDLPMCVCANLTSSDEYYSHSVSFLQPTSGENGNHLPVEQNPQMEYPAHHESAFINQHQGFGPNLSLPDAPFLPVYIPQGNELHVFPEDFFGFSEAENFVMHTTENGSFFIENELSEVSGFVSSSLQHWGFSHPLGQILKNKRELSCCFVLHSGNICYVKFTPHGIKFSGNQRGIVYVIDEAGVRTCWESFKSPKEMMSERDLWRSEADQHHNYFKEFCNCGVSACCHQRPSQQVSWNSSSKDETIRVERTGLHFFAETRELKNLNLTLEEYYMSSTLQHFGKKSGHIYIRSCQYRFNQKVFFNGKSLNIKYHTQAARLDSFGHLSLSNY